MSLFVLASKDGWVNIMYTGLDAVGVDQQVIHRAPVSRPTGSRYTTENENARGEKLSKARRGALLFPNFSLFFPISS